MGSSHFAGLRTWRRLVAAGVPAWWVDTAALLGSPALITDRTLIVVTSQSGASGEVVALFDALDGSHVSPNVIGVTNDMLSPLAQAATDVIPLHSGSEATVSTKSYVNSLAAHELLTAALLGDDPGEVLHQLHYGVDTLESGIQLHGDIGDDAGASGSRLTLIGGGDHFATALFGALIVKEATKTQAEGFLAGNFRHGPLELAGPGMFAFVLGVGASAEQEPLRRLAGDIAATGSDVLTFGSATVEGCEPIGAAAYDGFAGLVAGADLCHRICLQLARGRGVVPGEFRFGQKVTGL